MEKFETGSAPGSALFFTTYDTSKKLLSKGQGREENAFIHMTAAAMGEIAACSVRVPTEVHNNKKENS